LEGYIIEGLHLNFNTSSGQDTNLTVKVTDYATGDIWEYKVELNGTGGHNYEVTFFNEEGEYFVAFDLFKLNCF